MRTPKVLYPDEHIMCKPELSACPNCGGPSVMCDYLTWNKTVQMLDSILSVVSRPASCADPLCSGHDMRLLSTEGQQIAPPVSTYRYDVSAHIDWLRQERRDAYVDYRRNLPPRFRYRSLVSTVCISKSICYCLPTTSDNPGPTWPIPLDSMVA